MKKLLLSYFILLNLFFNFNLHGLKRDYEWLDSFCVIHFPHKLPPGFSMDLMSLIPETGPECNGVDDEDDDYAFECLKGSIYHGYWDPLFKKYLLHLKNQLEYCNQYPKCNCYWPEYSQKAAQISDLAYDLFQDLISGTKLNDLLENESKQQEFTQETAFLNLHGLTLYFIIQQFRFSDYYHVCKNIEIYSESNYDFFEFSIIKKKLDNILEVLGNSFFSIYTSCLQLHANLEIEQETYFIKLLNSDPFELPQNLNFSHRCSLIMNNIGYVERLSIFSDHSYITDLVLNVVCSYGYAEPFFLQSAILLEKGTILNNQLRYKESIPILTESIKLDSQNKDAFIERALAYFETNQIDLAIQDYRIAKKLSLKPIFLPSIQKSTDCFHNQPDPNATPYLKNEGDYFKGFAAGALEGSRESMNEFVPSTLSTLRGISHFLWTCVLNINPLMGIAPEFAKASYDYVNESVKYFQSKSSGEISDDIIPEFKELVSKWGRVSDYEKGKMAGFTMGKYGIGIFVCTKFMSITKRYHTLKRTNTKLTLEACEVSAENKIKILEQATRRATLRQNLFKNGKIKIHWDKQNKHILGSHNFIPDRSRITVSKKRLEELLEKYAGTGEPVADTLPGLAGYKERIDFGEIIGEFAYKEINIQKKAMTTKGIIHYDEKGFIHLVPARP